jgi:hypothetical protein
MHVHDLSWWHTSRLTPLQYTGNMLHPTLTYCIRPHTDRRAPRVRNVSVIMRTALSALPVRSDRLRNEWVPLAGEPFRDSMGVIRLRAKASSDVHGEIDIQHNHQNLDVINLS